MDLKLIREEIKFCMNLIDVSDPKMSEDPYEYIVHSLLVLILIFNLIY